MKPARWHIATSSCHGDGYDRVVGESVAAAERINGELAEASYVLQARAEGPKAPSPGQRPGLGAFGVFRYGISHPL